jgi:hypothetical protein
MAAKFVEDPFSCLLQEFGRQAQDEVDVVWVTDLHEEEGVWGRTHFDSEPVTIELDANCPVIGAVDVLAHELAHVIAGFAAGHGVRWEAAKVAFMRACGADSEPV